MKKTDNYLFFYTKNDCFSQHSPHGFNHKGYHFKTAEHFMMFTKNLIFCLGENAKFEDVSSYIAAHKASGNQGKTLFEKILDANTPQQAKILGRSVANYTDEVWFRNRLKVVFYGNILKFRQNEDIRNIMLSMKGRKFVEAAGRDDIWGIGIDIDAIDIKNPPEPKDWRGKNLLGRVLDNVYIQIDREFNAQLEIA